MFSRLHPGCLIKAPTFQLVTVPYKPFRSYEINILTSPTDTYTLLFQTVTFSVNPSEVGQLSYVN